MDGIEATAFGEKPVKPLWELLALAGPTVLQMMSYTSMQFIDAWLLSHLGHVEAAAVAMSGLFAFSVTSFGFGLLQLVNTLVSQSFGKGELKDCGRFMWQGIWAGLIWSVMVVPMILPSSRMFHAMGHDDVLAGYESIYLRIVLLNTAIAMVRTTIGNFMLAIDRARVVFASAFLGVAVNAIVAYGIILGRLGMPQMGVVGAAWAQNIGVTVEMLVLIAFALQPTIRNKFNALDWRPRWAQMKLLIKLGWPAGAQLIGDVMAWSIFSSVVLASCGEPTMAANTFAFRFMSVSFMPAFGIGNAVTALVGRYIGKGTPEVAVRRANLGFKVNVVYMVGCGLLFFLFRNQLMRLFTSDPEVLRIGATMLVFAAVYQFADAIYCTYNGALRGAGDTLVPAIVTAILNWSMTVAGGYWVARRWPEWGASGPWVLATAYGFVLGAFIYTRFVRGKWREIQLASPGVNVGAESTKLSAVPSH